MPTGRDDGRRDIRASTGAAPRHCPRDCRSRSEEHTSELQSLMRISYAVFCLKKKNEKKQQRYRETTDNTHIRKTRQSIVHSTRLRTLAPHNTIPTYNNED